MTCESSLARSSSTTAATYPGRTPPDATGDPHGLPVRHQSASRQTARAAGSAAPSARSRPAASIVGAASVSPSPPYSRSRRSNPASATKHIIEADLASQGSPQHGLVTCIASIAASRPDGPSTRASPRSARPSSSRSRRSRVSTTRLLARAPRTTPPSSASEGRPREGGSAAHRCRGERQSPRRPAPRRGRGSLLSQRGRVERVAETGTSASEELTRPDAERCSTARSRAVGCALERFDVVGLEAAPVVSRESRAPGDLDERPQPAAGRISAAAEASGPASTARAARAGRQHPDGDGEGRARRHQFKTKSRQGPRQDDGAGRRDEGGQARIARPLLERVAGRGDEEIGRTRSGPGTTLHRYAPALDAVLREKLTNSTSFPGGAEPTAATSTPTAS